MAEYIELFQTDILESKKALVLGLSVDSLYNFFCMVVFGPQQ